MLLRSAAAAIALLFVAAAHAEVGDSESRLLARDLATQGADAYDAGDYELALDRFSRAAAVLDAPTITIMAGRTLLKLGRWTEALDRFQLTARTELAPDAPPAFLTATQEAAAEAENLQRLLPRLSVLLEATPATQDVTVEIDERAVTPAVLNVARPLDPGPHTISASTPTGRYFSTRIELHPEQTLEVRVPEPGIPAPPPPPPPAPVAAPAPPEAPIVTESERPAWLLPVAIGATTVGGVGAIITGILASSYKSKLDSACVKTGDHLTCPESKQDTVDGLETQRALFVASAALAVVGGGFTTYLLLTDADEPRVALDLGLHGATLRTAF